MFPGSLSQNLTKVPLTGEGLPRRFCASCDDPSISQGETGGDGTEWPSGTQSRNRQVVEEWGDREITSSCGRPPKLTATEMRCLVPQYRALGGAYQRETSKRRRYVQARPMRAISTVLLRSFPPPARDVRDQESCAALNHAPGNKGTEHGYPNGGVRASVGRASRAAFGARSFFKPSESKEVPRGNITSREQLGDGRTM